jgi:hypothetical protein
LKYGPVLMALCGELTGPGNVPHLATSAADLLHLLEPVQDRPLEFMILGYPDYRYVPYWTVDQQTFTCFPIVQPARNEPAPRSG